MVPIDCPETSVTSQKSGDHNKWPVLRFTDISHLNDEDTFWEVRR
jgi:hypothetical protein